MVQTSDNNVVTTSEDVTDIVSDDVTEPVSGDSADTTAPEITQLFPKNSMSILSRQVFISGLVSDDNAMDSVVISSGDESVVADLDGETFSALVSAVPGENSYTVVATDESGNETVVNESYYFGSRISGGNSHSGIIRNGSLYAWGRNNKGQSGTGFYY